MRVIDLIDKKKRGEALTKEEIDFFIQGVTDGSIPDYQISAWLMAVYFKSMTDEETANLTQAMVNSGEVIDFGKYASKIIDKHSTGGVGDKITLTLIPLLASMGVGVAKLSGKGLGHTGGTIDKLESIPKFNTKLTIEEMFKQLDEINVAIGAQTQKLTPADGKLYALRDVTATVDSMPLIASSVVSKKIASGAHNIILDVKYGSGAFFKTPEEATRLSELMVKIGDHLGRSIVAVITSMAEPLGRAVGNALEVIESIEFLKGNIKEGDLAELTYDFAALALVQMGKFENTKLAKEEIKSAISSGAALKKFAELIKTQGGNPEVIYDYSLFPQAKYRIEVKVLPNQVGYLKKIDAYKIAYGCKLLGAGREKKEDAIDYGVGVFLNKKSGEKIQVDETLYTIYANSEEKANACKSFCDNAFEFSADKPQKEELIYKIVK